MTFFSPASLMIGFSVDVDYVLHCITFMRSKDEVGFSSLHVKLFFNQITKRSTSLPYNWFKLPTLRLFVAKAVWHKKMGPSHFQPIATKNTIFQQSGWTKHSRFLWKSQPCFLENSFVNHEFIRCCKQPCCKSSCTVIFLYNSSTKNEAS